MFQTLHPAALCRLLMVAGLLSGAAEVLAAAQVTGILLDAHCAPRMEERIMSDGLLVGGMISAEAHTRECDLKPACQRSGYGVLTEDEKFLKFDSEGSRKAIEAIKASSKLDDIKVEVTGVVQGDTIKVETLKLL